MFDDCAPGPGAVLDPCNSALEYVWGKGVSIAAVDTTPADHFLPPPFDVFYFTELSSLVSL